MKGTDTFKLDLTLTVARMQRPIPHVRVPGRMPGEHGFYVQVPVFANERLKTEAKLPAGKTLFFGGLASHDNERLLMTFIRRMPVKRAATAPSF